MSYMSSIQRYDGLQSRFKPLKGLYLYGFAELPAILPVLEKCQMSVIWYVSTNFYVTRQCHSKAYTAGSSIDTDALDVEQEWWYQ